MNFNSCAVKTFFQFAVLFLIAVNQTANANTVEKDRDYSVLSNAAWSVQFDDKNSSIRCRHGKSGMVVQGRLAFEVWQGNKHVSWPVAVPRDAFERRLALVDDGGNVQGYVVFYCEGDSLVVRPVHRPPHNYAGTLRFNGHVRPGRRDGQNNGNAFACRTRPPHGPVKVVQMAIGAADSALNDSIFEPRSDRLLRFEGESVCITTARPEEFPLRLTARIDRPSAAEMRIEPIENYYRDRFVPRYRPINKRRCPRAPSGWLSWCFYFDEATEEVNLAEARVAAKKLLPLGMEFWVIESWQDNSDKLPVADFHCMTLRSNPRQFPHGMKWLADELRKLGFKPGLWTVPFGTGDLQFYNKHKDWFLHNADGVPMRNWSGRFVFDPSQDEVLQLVEKNFRTMARQWGYEFFKIDGMSGRNHNYSAHFFERPEVRAAFKNPCKEPFKRYLETLRRGIGDKAVWSACQGHYSGNEVGLADGGRTGADLISPPGIRPHWERYREQAKITLNQLFVNNIVWYTDPDTLMVGTYAPMETARLATTVVGLPGQMMFSSDKLGELPDARMKLLQQTLPVCNVRPLDLFPIFDMAPVWDLKVKLPFAKWDVVAVFNWGKSAAETTVRFADLGLPAGEKRIVYDFWNEKLLGVFDEQFTQTIPLHGSGLYATHTDKGRPQFISTDRHLTQGAVSLRDLNWNEDTRTLSGRTHLIADYPVTLSFHVPAGYRLIEQQTSGGKLSLLSSNGQSNLLRVRLESERTGEVVWRLGFEK
ncbi:MAG: alpha-galactosidase [Pirellulales bacterium]|nr:alpha-galactosidase [Pirellulales bacterium]